MISDFRLRVTHELELVFEEANVEVRVMDHELGVTR